MTTRDIPLVVLEAFLGVGLGAAIGLTLAVPPGPVNALIASRTVTRSWRAGAAVGAGAITADTIYLVISLFIPRGGGKFEGILPYISLVGAAVMAYLAWGAFRVWRIGGTFAPVAPKESMTSYTTGFVANMSSPYPLLWWFTVGLVLVSQFGIAILVGFYAGLFLWITSFPLALRESQRRFAQTYPTVLLVSIGILAVFAVLLLWSAIDSLL